MRASGVNLLRAASEIAGGDRALAEYLGIREALIAKFMSGKYALPDTVLFQAVDMILADRESRVPIPGEPDGESAEASKPDA